MLSFLIVLSLRKKVAPFYRYELLWVEEFVGALCLFCAESDWMKTPVSLLRSAASHHALIVSGAVVQARGR